VQAVVLAGGLGTRMAPETQRVPKSLLPVAGRPFIAWQLELLERSGFGRVTLCIGHLGHAVRDLVGDGSSFGLRVDYSEDGPTLLGTAGALRRACDRLEETFLVTYGDSYLPFDYSLPWRDLEGHPEALGTMTVYQNRGRWGASNTAVEGDRVTRYAKASPGPDLDHIDYGALAVRRSVISDLPPDVPWGLDAVQSDLAERGVLRALLARERFFEIGSPEGLRDLQRRLGGSS
jgi:N-acetyl-alpha-D-muramate 1-phosphate uridylyltransferase